MHELIEAHQKTYIFNNEIVHHIVFTSLNIIVYIFCTWLGIKLIDKLVDKLSEVLKKRDDNNILLRFMPLLRKVTKILFAFVFLVFVLQMYGFSVSTLVTGIGVGGVVFGLAAQKTIINIFGSVSLIVDNAYKVGDYIAVSASVGKNDVEGFVEDITLRSTKIRCLDGTLYNIPNGNISDGVVKNYSHLKHRLFKETINLTYSTTSEQIEKAKEICLSVLKAHPSMKGSFSVQVSALNSYSVDLQLLANIKPVALLEVFKVKNDILSEIYKQFNENGIAFAFPTQTIELKQ